MGGWRKWLRWYVPGEGITLPWEDFSDPEEDREIERRGARFEHDEQALIAALRREGLEIESTVDLLDERDYRAQVPTLVEWLGRTANPDLREVIVRSLAVPWAKPHATSALLAEFAAPDRSELDRWTVGNSIEALEATDIADELIPLVLDRRYGIARQMLAVALGHTGSPQALAPLVALLDDPEVAGHATIGLGKLRRPEAAPHLRRMLDHEREWVRDEARLGLRALEV